MKLLAYLTIWIAVAAAAVGLGRLAALAVRELWGDEIMVIALVAAIVGPWTAKIADALMARPLRVCEDVRGTQDDARSLIVGWRLPIVLNYKDTLYTVLYRAFSKKGTFDAYISAQLPLGRFARYACLFFGNLDGANGSRSGFDVSSQSSIDQPRPQGSKDRLERGDKQDQASGIRYALLSAKIAFVAMCLIAFCTLIGNAIDRIWSAAFEAEYAFDPRQKRRAFLLYASGGALLTLSCLALPLLLLGLVRNL